MKKVAVGGGLVVLAVLAYLFNFGGGGLGVLPEQDIATPEEHQEPVDPDLAGPGTGRDAPLEVTVRGTEYLIGGESRSLADVLRAVEGTPEEQTTRVKVLLEGSAQRDTEHALFEALKQRGIPYAPQEVAQ